MNDLISREATLNALGERPMVWTSDDDYSLGERNQYDIDRLAIETVPSAERHGHWIYTPTNPLGYVCSECGKTMCRFNYCPNCGAKME